MWINKTLVIAHKTGQHFCCFKTLVDYVCWPRCCWSENTSKTWIFIQHIWTWSTWPFNHRKPSNSHMKCCRIKAFTSMWTQKLYLIILLSPTAYRRLRYYSTDTVHHSPTLLWNSSALPLLLYFKTTGWNGTLVRLS